MAGKKKINKPTEFQWFSETKNWQVFQRISLYLYGKIFNDHFAEEHLVRGMFQDGIDIISFKKDTGKSSTIQCKHYQFLTLAELREIINLFVASNFLRTSDVFIITTTANLQEPAIKKYIFEQIAAFKTDYDIQFDVWDVTRLETELKRQYLLVEHYFGAYKAETYCFEPGFRKIAYEMVPGFISRNLKDTKAEPELFPWMASDRRVPRISLISLFVNGEERRRLVGIIAEAYEGKSTLFRQAAFELYQIPQTVPLFLDLKGVVIQPIDNLLNIQFNTWKEIPAKNLVVLIDGLDEVATDDLLDAIAHIRDFGTRYESIRIAVSCRKLYYSNYNLSSELFAYSFYELSELHYGQIVRYADSKTLGNGQRFYQEMELKGVSLLLANPFYLIKLMGWYNDPKESVPETRVAIARKLVEESFATSATRKVGKGRQLAHNKVRLKKLLQQLALAFQINSINSCDDEMIQHLFTLDDTILLKHSSVLNIDKGKWMFTNAFFQEQLAAMALQSYSVEEVIGLITVGKQIRKIKTKWIQTIATYLSMFNESDADRKKLLDVIERDNIELVAKSEGSTFLAAFKLDILKKIISRSLRLQSRLVLISEQELAGFIGNEKSAVVFLIELAGSDSPDITKVVCCHILKYIKLNQQQVSDYTAMACAQLLHATDKYYARLLLEGISHYRTGDRAFLEELLAKSTLVKHHEFRQGVYKFLEVQGLVSDYYDFILDGLEILYAHNSRITRSGSELRLMGLLLETDGPEQLKKLLKVIAGDRFHSFFRFKTEEMNDFLKKLQEKLIIAYAKDQSLLSPVVDCVIVFGLKRVDDEFRGMNMFFEKTNTYLQGLKLYLQRPSTERRVYDFSDHISPDCFAYLIEACRSELISRYELDAFISGMNHTGRSTEADQLQQLTWEAFGKPDPAIKKSHDRYAMAMAYKADNDIRFISSAAAFEKGIRAFFKAIGKEAITFKELHNHEDRMTKLIKVGSDFISHLIHEVGEEQQVTMAACIAFINDETSFNVFRVKSLMDYGFGKNYQEQAITHLKDYYLGTVTLFAFPTINKDSEYRLKVQANQYLKIWNKYPFETPDDVLLEFIRMDGEGLNFIQSAQHNRRESVALHLVEHFEKKSKIEVFKQQVLKNLQNGIGDHSVLGTHIELCRHLGIVKAIPYIRKAIYEDFRPRHNDYGFMDIFRDLGGDLGELLPAFEEIVDFEDYTFIHLVKLLSGSFPAEVENRLTVALQKPNLSAEKKRDIARHLADLGNKEGFQFIIGQLDPQKETPYTIQSNWHIWNVDTEFGLSLLEPFVFTLVDDTMPKFRFQESVDHLLLEMLRGFAGKGESDLQLVLALLHRKSEEFQEIYPRQYGQLLWYGEQMEEAFRKSNSQEMSITKMKAFLARILD